MQPDLIVKCLLHSAHCSLNWQILCRVGSAVVLTGMYEQLYEQYLDMLKALKKRRLSRMLVCTKEI